MTTHSVLTFPTPEDVVDDIEARNKSLRGPADDEIHCCGGSSAPYLVVLHSESKLSND